MVSVGVASVGLGSVCVCVFVAEKKSLCSYWLPFVSLKKARIQRSLLSSWIWVMVRAYQRAM